jgi:hypothetical protein
VLQTCCTSYFTAWFFGLFLACIQVFQYSCLGQGTILNFKVRVCVHAYGTEYVTVGTRFQICVGDTRFKSLLGKSYPSHSSSQLFFHMSKQDVSLPPYSNISMGVVCLTTLLGIRFPVISVHSVLSVSTLSLMLHLYCLLIPCLSLQIIMHIYFIISQYDINFSILQYLGMT